jgi:restriction endonuclease S subunit
MKVKLQDIAQIQFGHYAQPSNKGTIPYLQAKHFNEHGQLVNGSDTFLEEDEKANQNILKDGDILYAGKGFRFFATAYKKEMGKAIASSIFFILKADTNKILPEYLAAVLNMPKSVLHFQQSGAGSSIPSIRKSELGDFSFNLIPIAQQEKVVALHQLYVEDINITKQLITQKQQLFQSVISKIIN